MSTVPFVDLQAQYRTIKEDVDAAVASVLTKQNFILGAQVQEFEKAFAEFIGAAYGVGVSSGVDALRLALAALDIGPGDDVIVPANTFIATALAVAAVGARPVLVDCDAGTYNIDPALIPAALTAKTKAIIPVHLTGQSADMDPILALAEAKGLHIVEDAAQAHGTKYKQRGCGAMGQAGCFSFYPGKNLGAYGDGGLVTTNDAALAERMQRLRNYGQRVKYEHVELGLNARLDTIQAAVLGVKLPHLAGWNAARARHAAKYRQLLAGVGDLVLQKESADSTHIYHLFMLQTSRRDALQRHLDAAGVQTVIHYPIPIHLQAAFADLGYAKGSFPVAEALATHTLSLPMFPELTEGQIERVAGAVVEFYAKA